MTNVDTLLREIEALAPWRDEIALRGGITTAGRAPSSGAMRDAGRELARVADVLFPDGLAGRAVLDCGCSSGGISFAAKDRGAARVLAFDRSSRHIAQARLVAAHREGDASGIRFVEAGPEHLATLDETFDLTFVGALFTALPDPVAGLKPAADRTTDILVIDTPALPRAADGAERPALVRHRVATEGSEDDLGWLPSGPIVLASILRWLGFPETTVFLWTEAQAGDEPAARIALAAARRPGRLGALPRVDAPTPLLWVDPEPARAAPERPPARPAGGRGPTAGGRPLRWEDDLSVNAHDTAPFDNGLPISERIAELERVVANSFLQDEAARLPLAACAARDTYPIPPSDDREGYLRAQDALFWVSGLVDFHQTMAAVEARGIAVERFLEVGCATGRVLRHVAIQAQVADVWGTDINHRHVRWLNQHMPRNVRALAVPALPGLPLPDDHFDVVAAFSVFTHIDVFETAFLAEVRRVLKPGGLGVLTAHTEHTWERLREKAAGPGVNLATRILAHHPGFGDLLRQPMPKGVTRFRHSETGPYRGNVFHSTDYIEEVWGRFLTIEEIIPYGHRDQTVILVRP